MFRTRRQRGPSPPEPIAVYRNASATIGLFDTGPHWTVSVGQRGRGESTFRFTDRQAAEGAASWLSHQDLSGLVRAGWTWYGLVDAIHERRPSTAATTPAR